MPNQDIHTQWGSTSDISVACPSGHCSANTRVTNVDTDSSHKKFAYTGEAKPGSDPMLCPVTLTCTKGHSWLAKLVKMFRTKDGPPDSGTVTVTLTTEPQPTPVPVNYVS